MARLIYPKSAELVGRFARDPRIADTLGALREHHPDTYEHSVRVGKLCVDLGYGNGLPDSEVNVLGFGGLLHDIGKLGVPDGMLSKPGTLDRHENGVVRRHAGTGRLMLDTFEPPEVGIVVSMHHRFQPEPYPDHDQLVIPVGTRDRTWRIDMLAQMVAVADIYDALANPRAYKPAYPRTLIEEKMREGFTGDTRLIGQVLLRHEEALAGAA